MTSKFSRSFWQVVGIGSLAGMRATAGNLVACHILSHKQSARLRHTTLAFMQSVVTANIAKVLFIGELIGDKLPATGDRIVPLGVAGRAFAGGLAGAAIYKAEGDDALRGALLGAAAAVAATYASFYLRKYIVQKTGIFDPIIGAAEDAVLICGAIHLAEI